MLTASEAFKLSQENLLKIQKENKDINRKELNQLIEVAIKTGDCYVNVMSYRFNDKELKDELLNTGYKIVEINDSKSKLSWEV